MCTTTPLPITPMVPGCSMPEGRRWNLNVLSPTTIVCPALDPPATRAQMLYFCDRMSTFGHTKRDGLSSVQNKNGSEESWTPHPFGGDTGGQ